uniref:Uncharacterized protein n=1 Tax=Panagrolaimus sp. JU765 TaxID=591449 RepID=A0AC34RTI7_9BILA
MARDDIPLVERQRIVELVKNGMSYRTVFKSTMVQMERTPWILAGITVGVVAIVGIGIGIFVIVYCCVCKKKPSKEEAKGVEVKTNAGNVKIDEKASKDGVVGSDEKTKLLVADSKPGPSIQDKIPLKDEHPSEISEIDEEKVLEKSKNAVNANQFAVSAKSSSHNLQFVEIYHICCIFCVFRKKNKEF